MDQVQADIHRVAESFDRNANTMGDSVSRAGNVLEHAGQDVNRAADVLDLAQTAIRSLAENLDKIAKDTTSP